MLRKKLAYGNDGIMGKILLSANGIEQSAERIAIIRIFYSSLSVFSVLSVAYNLKILYVLCALGGDILGEFRVQVFLELRRLRIALKSFNISGISRAVENSLTFLRIYFSSTDECISKIDSISAISRGR